MHESTISTSRVIASTLWTWVVVLMAAAWIIILWAPQHWPTAMMLAATSCASSGIAAVMHVRCYAIRMCTLIRTSSTAGRPPASQLATVPRHTVR